MRSSAPKPSSEKTSIKATGTAGYLNHILVFVTVILLLILTVILYKRLFSEKQLCLEINGKAIGYVSNVADFENACTQLCEDITENYDAKYALSSKISYVQKSVAQGSEIKYLTVDEFVNNLVSAEPHLEYAYAVYLNGYYIANSNSEDSARQAITRAAENIASEILKEESSFTSVTENNEIKTERVIVTKDAIWSSDDIYNLLCSQNEHQKNHAAAESVLNEYKKYIIMREKETACARIEVQKEAYIKSAAESYGINYKGDGFDRWLEEYKTTDGYISAMEAFDKQIADASDIVTTPNTAPQTNITDPYIYYQSSAASALLKFKVAFTEKVYETIPRDVVITEKDTRKTDYSAVTKEGKDGVAYTEYSVIFSEGKAARTEIENSVIIEPISEHRTVGSSEYTDPGVVTGIFLWPIETDNMLVSSFFGEQREKFDGDAYHFGMDILGYKDDPVWASDGGTVEFCGWYRSYGNLVIIDHGDGKRSYYAHLRDKEMTVGEKVYQGQVIGHIGLTGSTTNYHLHFEIRVDNAPCDPLDFLPETELRQW